MLTVWSNHIAACLRVIELFGIVVSLIVASGEGRAQEIPSFLKPYYTPMFASIENPFDLTDHSIENNTTHYRYISRDRRVNLTVAHFPCQDQVCKTVYDNATKYVDDQAGKGGGEFKTYTDSEFRANSRHNLQKNYIFVFRLSSSIQVLSYTALLTRNLAIDAAFDRLKILVNRERYEAALADGNVGLGRWNLAIREYYQYLLQNGNTQDALEVLRNLIRISPFDFQAQLDFAAHTPNEAAAKNSAMAVLSNAESTNLQEKAAQFLHVGQQESASSPFVNNGDRGLQVILLPLGAVDVSLLAEAGKIYESITGITVKISRLPETWTFGKPNRLPDQKAIQQAIVQKAGPNTDFSGWDEERYELELLKTAADAGPLARFQVRAYLDKLKTRSGQFLVDPYLDRLGESLESIRSSDKKVVYVGVTDANIYSGDANFIFSSSKDWKGFYVSILSCAMMTAGALGEPYESRKRLAERLAKELVPASLKALGIPRPAGPTDPYSYSSGVQRLNEKSLQLSQPTKDAIAAVR